MADSLRALRETGIRIAIDDFGTGYSSLSYLRSFPIDALKIVRSFVSGIGEDGRAETLISAIVSPAHQLGIETIAEGHRGSRAGVVPARRALRVRAGLPVLAPARC